MISVMEVLKKSWAEVQGVQFKGVHFQQSLVVLTTLFLYLGGIQELREQLGVGVWSVNCLLL